MRRPHFGNRRPANLPPGPASGSATANVNFSATRVTVTRGYESTIAAAHGNGATISDSRAHLPDTGAVGLGCPTTSQPVLTDPFAHTPRPTVGDPALGPGPSLATCPSSGSLGTAAAPKTCGIVSQTVTLQPGTYYGGICVGALSSASCNTGCTSGTAHVTMAPGTYVIAGGGFFVCGSSTLSAPDVLIYDTNDPSHNTSTA